MWGDIVELIDKEDYTGAGKLLEQKKAELEVYDDVFGILEANICEAQGNAAGMLEAISKGLT
jgi:hypothetical protein